LTRVERCWRSAIGDHWPQLRTSLADIAASAAEKLHPLLTRAADPTGAERIPWNISKLLAVAAQ